MLPLRVAVLISGSGTLLQALIDACVAPDYPARIVGVISDSPDAPGLRRARSSGLPTAAVALTDFPDRATWDVALRDAIERFEPDWVVSAGFMRLVGPAVLSRYPMRILNTHPALLPSFPGAHAVRDTLAHGVKVTGSTIHLVDEGIDTGPIVAQRPVAVEPGDDEVTLHERIKVVERELLVDVVRQLGEQSMHVSDRKVRLQ